MASRLTFYLALVAVCSFAAFVPPPSSAQNISIDGRFSPAQTLRAIGGNYSVDANLGKQVGSNLFHRFGGSVCRPARAPPSAVPRRSVT